MKRLAPSFVTVVAALAACNEGGGATSGTGTSDMPTWDEVKSGHPEGATNPPSAVLTLLPDGRCFKSWEGGMGGLPRDVVFTQVGKTKRAVRFAAGADARPGKRIQCPEGAAETLAAHQKASSAASASASSPPAKP